MKIMEAQYGNAPIELIEEHKRIAKRMGEIFDANPQDPQLFELSKRAEEIEHQIQEINHWQ